MRDHGLIRNQDNPHAKLKSVGFDAVRLDKGFWFDRQKVAHGATLPHLWDLLADADKGHVLQNLRIAAGLEEGKFEGVHWDDAWLAKWIEAAAVIFASTGDKKIDRQMDEAITLLAKVQEPDGYLASQTQANGEERFQDTHYHELYTMGHMITAAVIHHRTTDKTSFLDIARKIGDYVSVKFSGDVPKEMVPFPFNPSIIMGLAELFRETGERRYIEAAQGFVDRRGSVPRQWGDHPKHDWMGGDLCQDRVPLRQENEMVGHSVLSTYLYAGATDIIAETGEQALHDALKRIWQNFTQRKMFVNGGACAAPMGISNRKIGGHHVDIVHEAAGPEYFLPNALSYNETCAQIGVVMWAWRMMSLTPDAEYADVMEQTLYAGVLSGVGLDGTSWFYRNILRWHGGEFGPYKEGNSRYTCVRFQPGRNSICCPTNLLRLEAEFHNYLYNVSDDGLWIHHYAANTLNTVLPDGSHVELVEETDYPWDGKIRLTFGSVGDAEFSLKLRIPGWADGATIKVNGAEADTDAAPGTYADIHSAWQAGDVVELDLPMRPRLLVANPLVEELRNQVAVMRGPILYCLESHDAPEGVPLHEIHLPRNIKLTSLHVPELLNGVTVLDGIAQRIKQGDWDNQLYKSIPLAPAQPVAIRLVPYYAWANRGIGAMTVWMPCY